MPSALAALLALVVAGCGASGPPPEPEVLEGAAAAGSVVGDYRPTGALVADTGFRPVRHGFGFENYGHEGRTAELTAAEVEELFGPRVCASGTRRTCRLIPPAQAWLEAENDATAAGHCFGLAVLASRFYHEDLDPDAFGAPLPFGLQLPSNPGLQRSIAQANALQEVPSVRAKAMAGTPNEQLDRLVAGLRAGEVPFALGLYRGEGQAGHAVTPYAVEDRGEGRFAVLVYDNNFPGVTRAVSFDRRANAWRFVAQTNPEDPEQLYAGDAQRSNLVLFPTEVEGRLPCPFCPPEAGAADADDEPRYNEVVLEGDPTNHARVLIEDPQGRKLGHDGRREVEEIPGAQVARRLNNADWKIDSEPAYFVPVARGDLSITVDGTELERPTVHQLDVIGPGDDVEVGGIALRPGEKVRIDVKADGSEVRYTTDPRHDESALMRVGLATATTSWDFHVKARRLVGGATIRLALDHDRMQFGVDTHGTKQAGTYDVRFDRMTAKGTETFSHGAVDLPADALARLDYHGFRHHGQALPFTIERDDGRTTRIALRG